MDEKNSNDFPEVIQKEIDKIDFQNPTSVFTAMDRIHTWIKLETALHCVRYIWMSKKTTINVATVDSHLKILETISKVGNISISNEIGSNSNTTSK